VRQTHIVIRNALADTQQHELAAACKSQGGITAFPAPS
jgi:hypothetical protein